MYFVKRYQCCSTNEIRLRNSVFQNSKAAMQDATFTMALVIGSENNGHGKLSIETVNEGEHKRAIGEFMQGQEQHHR